MTVLKPLLDNQEAINKEIERFSTTLEAIKTQQEQSRILADPSNALKESQKIERNAPLQRTQIRGSSLRDVTFEQAVILGGER